MRPTNLWTAVFMRFPDDPQAGRLASKPVPLALPLSDDYGFEPRPQGWVVPFNHVPSSEHSEIPDLVVEIWALGLIDVERWYVEITSSGVPVVDDHACTDGHEEDSIGS